MEFVRTTRRTITISLIPLIDVSVFLLIFFMLAGTIEKFDIVPVDPPIANSGEVMPEGHLVVLLGRHDEIIIDDEILDMPAMQAALKQQLSAHPDKVVTVRADASVPANRVIDVMDAIKVAGGKQLSIVTQTLEQ